MLGKWIKRDDLLQKRIDQAVKDFEELSPEQKVEHRRAQRKSWVIGELMLEHLDMTREEAERIYNKVEQGL